MDAKNDDSSAGSDSLDKSLQKKCVVDDAGDGAQQKSSAAVASGSGVMKTSELEEMGGRSTKKLKTEKGVGDGEIDSSAGGGGGGGGGGSTATASHGHKADGKTSEATTNSTVTKVAATTNDGSHKPDTQTAADSDTTSTSSCSTSSSSSSSPGKAFETKVKQISKNLKETTLADAASKLLPEGTALHKKISLEDTSSSSSSSNSSEYEQQIDGDKGMATKSLPAAQASTPNRSDSLQPDDGDLETSVCSAEANDDDDTLNHRSKKVRFHPDVKENDGGNRVIPKKKKKIKSASGDGQYPSTRLDFEMELDEEEDEEEEEFDLAKTIAEAQDYLKLHPLTFARPQAKGGVKLKDGLLDEEELRNVSESSEEEDVYENSEPENGVERILGKHIKGGKVEFLLRYADRPGLFWASEDFIWKQCPSILNLYELNREKRQERLMRHVAKRQNIRQRYTDF